MILLCNGEKLKLSSRPGFLRSCYFCRFFLQPNVGYLQILVIVLQPLPPTIEWQRPLNHYRVPGPRSIHFKHWSYSYRSCDSQTPLNGHRLRTPATSTTNGRAHNNSTTCCTTNSPPTDKKFATSQHLDMSRCWALALRCGKFVVEFLWARPLVVLYNMSVAGVRVVEFGPNAA